MFLFFSLMLCFMLIFLRGTFCGFFSLIPGFIVLFKLLFELPAYFQLLNCLLLGKRNQCLLLLYCAAQNVSVGLFHLITWGSQVLLPRSGLLFFVKFFGNVVGLVLEANYIGLLAHNSVVTSIVKITTSFRP